MVRRSERLRQKATQLGKQAPQALQYYRLTYLIFDSDSTNQHEVAIMPARQHVTLQSETNSLPPRRVSSEEAWERRRELKFPPSPLDRWIAERLASPVAGQGTSHVRCVLEVERIQVRS